MDPANAQKLEHLYAKKKKLAQETKVNSDEIANVTAAMMEYLLEHHITFIDSESKGVGTGPWFMIEKLTSSASWTKERYLLYFAWLLKIQANPDPEVRKQVETPYLVYKKAKEFLRMYDKRDFVMKRIDNPTRFYTKEELETWKRLGDRGDRK